MALKQENLPIPADEAPRIHAIANHAARAMTVGFTAVVPYSDDKQPNPFSRYGYTFVFKVFTRRVEVRISIRDLAARTEPELIDRLTEVLKRAKFQSLTGSQNAAIPDRTSLQSN